jgi:MFS family permease
LTNTYGRKVTIIASGLLSSISLMCAGLVWNFSLWMMFVLAAGVGFAGLETAGRVYLSELSGHNFRINSMAVFNMVWAASQILLVLIKSLVNYWRYLFLYFMGGSYLLAVVFGVFFLEQSPKYLLLTNRIDVSLPGMQALASADDASQPKTRIQVSACSRTRTAER